MTRTRRTIGLAGSALVLLAACGDTDDGGSSGKAATRTIEVDMVDIAFEPDRLEVEQGETVRFVFINRGEVPHDAFIGDEAAQADHEQEMRDAAKDEHGGGHEDEDEDAVTVEPGDTAELTYTFDEPGTLEIGCHQVGHYDDGMKTTVEVA
jgi:uncharacterized cupredoxin-like copper-binding protein